ncbi:GNAT family N-acetyltransferase [Wukongibacter baidiensis]|uniref:GNAT family N-acetyltransferase n=1 Tax=Wukongibacter baidiensis TaxID=1723361 RepID=UPI003D7FFF10
MSKISETERLILRTLEPDDLDSVMNFWGDNEVMKYCGGSLEDKEIIAKAINNYMNSQRERGFSAYAVILKKTDEVIGACGYNYTKNDSEIELIYHFAKKHWGKGYATEAGRACIEYARKNLHIDKIIASVDPNHNSSRRILEKLGFKYIGMKWFEDTKQDEPYFELDM